MMRVDPGQLGMRCQVSAPQARRGDRHQFFIVLALLLMVVFIRLRTIGEDMCAPSTAPGLRAGFWGCRTRPGLCPMSLW